MSNGSSSKKTFPQSEEELLGFWGKNKVFEETLKKTKNKKPFVFYEGPPYANGRPGIHHVEARAFKDVILRFKTMQGFYVRRKSGWDTHGLPTEMEVEKKLGVRSKKEIEEKIGVERFVEEAKKSVFFYKDEWEKLTRRMGYWLDLENPYVTMSNDYVESLWQVFSQIHKNGYLYKDFKVLPWCPRCGTALSSHELAQGYKDVKDKSVFIKFRLKDKPDTFVLSWTTTPWTLPGNAALAINSGAVYSVAEKAGEKIIVAKSRLEVLGHGWSVLEEKKGTALVGLSYEPLFDVPKLKSPQSYKIYSADFVNMEEGTGIVHTAVMYGEDDFRLGKKAGLPTFHTVSEEGKFIESLSDGLAGKAVKEPETEKIIIEVLKKKSFLFKEELYEHSYPFCWRCGSALIYYAKNSWFLKTTAVKDRMLKENKKIGWHPEFIRDGRFGEWLRENVDWAISRERYWGMPLPVWECRSCENREVVGSLKELDAKGPEQKTRIFMMRHGEADHNVKNIVGPATPERDYKNNLTKKGIKQVERTAELLKREKIGLIVSSPLNRARQTAEITAKTLGVKVEVNERIYDYDVGDFHNKSIKEAHKEFPFSRKLVERFPGGESLRDVRERMMAELKNIAGKYAGKNIVVVGHGDPLWVLNAAAGGAAEKDYEASWYPKTGEFRELDLHNWPYNKEGELDLHRPYIDEIKIRCLKCKSSMTRVKEVADVWFDSGAMPFAQDHVLFGKNPPAGGQYPADYIAEGIDQTRGWFYTLLAVSSLLKKPSAYKNVVVVGLVLDEKGEKMSKSKGNTVEPLPLFDKYGADAVRWYFYTVNQPWDEKLFREPDIAEASRRFLNIFWNSFVYWQTYKNKSAVEKKKPKSLINKWFNARLNQVGYEATEALEKFDIVRAARLIENFVAEDMSRWYIRRIRDAIRFGKKEEKKEISDVLGLALFETAKLAAPFVPFLADKMYLEVGVGKKSIHLESWGKFKKPSSADKKLVDEMNEARKIVSLALEARAKAGIKVRQPLALLKAQSPKPKALNKELIDLVKGEINVKEVVFDSRIKSEVELDTKITPELKEEGRLRELIRHIQEKRKESGLKPSDKITFAALTDERGRAFVKKHEKTLMKEAGVSKIVLEGGPVLSGGKSVSLKFSVD